eukprot:3485125-Amphidinium_carterae.2
MGDQDDWRRERRRARVEKFKENRQVGFSSIRMETLMGERPPTQWEARHQEDCAQPLSPTNPMSEGRERLYAGPRPYARVPDWRRMCPGLCDFPPTIEYKNEEGLYPFSCVQRLPNVDPDSRETIEPRRFMERRALYETIVTRSWRTATDPGRSLRNPDEYPWPHTTRTPTHAMGECRAMRGRSIGIDKLRWSVLHPHLQRIGPPPERVYPPQMGLWGEDPPQMAPEPESGPEYYAELAKRVRISARERDERLEADDFAMTHDLTASSSSRPDVSATHPSSGGTLADEGRSSSTAMPAMSSAGHVYPTGDPSSGGMNIESCSCHDAIALPCNLEEWERQVPESDGELVGEEVGAVQWDQDERERRDMDKPRSSSTAEPPEKVLKITRQ